MIRGGRYVLVMLTARGVAVLAIVSAAVAVSQSFGRFTYSVLLTDIRDDLGVSNTIAGTLGSANLAAYLFGSLVVSLVVGRLGVVRIAQLGLASVTVGLALLAWGDNGLVVAVGLVITGLTAAGVWVTAPALATAQLGPERRASAIGLTSLGVGAGMVIASYLDTVVEWREVYRIEVVIALVTLAASLLVIRGTETYAPQRIGLDAIRGVPGWRPLLAAYGAYGATIALVITFLVALLEDDAGYSSSRATAAFTTLAIGSVIGGPLFGHITDRFGRRFGLASSFALLSAMSLVIATGHRPAATMAAFVFGASFTGGPVAVGARIADHTDGSRFGAAYGMATLVFGIGLSLGPQLGGALADWTGSFRPAFVIASAAALSGAWLAGRAVPAVGDVDTVA